MPINDPDQTHRLFADAANAGDVDSLVDLYEPGGVIVERSGELTVGHDAIRRHLDALVSLSPKMDILESRTVRVGDVTLCCSRWRATATTPDGHPIDMEYRGSEVLRHQSDGTWLLVIDNPWGVELEYG